MRFQKQGANCTEFSESVFKSMRGLQRNFSQAMSTAGTDNMSLGLLPSHVVLRQVMYFHVVADVGIVLFHWKGVII